MFFISFKITDIGFKLLHGNFRSNNKTVPTSCYFCSIQIFSLFKILIPGLGA